MRFVRAEEKECKNERSREVLPDFLMLWYGYGRVKDGQKASKVTVNVSVENHTSLQETIDSHVLREPLNHSATPMPLYRQLCWVTSLEYSVRVCCSRSEAVVGTEIGYGNVLAKSR